MWANSLDTNEGFSLSWNMLELNFLFYFLKKSVRLTSSSERYEIDLKTLKSKLFWQKTPDFKNIL